MKYSGVLWRAGASLPALAIFLLIAQGCDNDALLDLNKNPVDPTLGVQEQLLAGAQHGLGMGRSESSRNNLIYCSQYVQLLCSPTWGHGNYYVENGDYNSALWEEYLENVVRNLVYVLDNTSERDDQDVLLDPPVHKKYLFATALLYKSFAIHRMTDMYGDMPYQDLGRGLLGPGFSFPRYIGQKELYDYLIRDVKRARDLLTSEPGVVGLGVQDIIYGGDIEKARKFANSLLIRIGMRLVRVDEALARSTVQEAANHDAGFIETNEQNANLPRNASSFPNGNSQVMNFGSGLDAFWPSSRLVEWLKNNDHDPSKPDPRLQLICGGIPGPPDNVEGNDGASKVPGQVVNADVIQASSQWVTSEEYYGIRNGFDFTDPDSEHGIPGIIGALKADGATVPGADASEFDRAVYFTSLNPRLFRLGAPSFLITASQTLLYVAEAKARGWDTGDTPASDLVGRAIEMDVSMYGEYDQTLQGVNIDEYVESLGLARLSTADLIREINEQYWVCSFLDFIESWINWKRSGVPALSGVDHPLGITGGNIPRVFAVESSEADVNPNFDPAGTRETDLITIMRSGRVWWDVP